MHTLSTTALQRQSTEVPIPSHFTCLFRSTFCMFCNPLQHQPPSLARALHYQSSPLLRCKSSNHFLIPGAFCGANLIKMHTHIPGTYTLPSLSFSVAASAPLCRVGQNHIYNIYIRDSWQKNHQIYGHIRCIYTVLANPTFVWVCFFAWAQPNRSKHAAYEFRLLLMLSAFTWPRFVTRVGQNHICYNYVANI